MLGLFNPRNRVTQELKEFEALLEEAKVADEYTRVWVTKHIICKTSFKDQNKVLRMVLDTAKRD